MSEMMRRMHSRRVWKKCVLTCTALAVLTSGCATTAAPPAAPAAGKVKQHRLTGAEPLERARVVRTSTGPLPAPAGGPTTVTFDIGEHCIGYRYSKQSHCAGNVPLEDCQAAASVGDC